MEEEQKEEKKIKSQEEKTCEMQHKVRQEVEKVINKIVDNGLEESNVKVLGELIDIHKDISNEKYWKIKEENYMRTYGRDEYGARMRDSRGRYMGDDGYGRRGRYRGHEMLDDMKEAYHDYMESGEYGNYGTHESMQKIEIMTDSLMDFIDHLKHEAKTPEERQLIDRKLKEIGRM